MTQALTIEGGVTHEDWWGLAPQVVDTLRELGWQRDDESVRQVLPAVARHGNAVVAIPPSPARAAPALAGMIAAIAASRGRGLILAAPALVTAVGREVARLAQGGDVRVVTANGPSRAARHLSSDTVDLLVTSPAVALSLHTRSALAIDRITALALAWPEDWHADEALTVLLGDLAKDSQRLVLTGDPRGIVELVERHARRSLTVSFSDSAALPGEPPRSLRAFQTGWTGRAEAIAELLETLDPAQVAVWAADRSDLGALRLALTELPGAAVVTGAQPEAPMIICHDLPTPGELQGFGAGRDVVLMVPPGTEGYVARIAPGIRPVRVAGEIDRLRDRDAALREEVADTIVKGDLRSAAYVLAPLFDRHDPQAIAAACFTLWRRGQVAATPAPESARRTEPATPVGGVANAKLWVGVGRRDDATPGDLVAVLIKEVGLTREAVGRIELRETFSLVEVPASEADRVASALTGLTIRRRKLVARVDRGLPSRGGGRPPRR